MSADLIERPWRCNVTGNIVGTDTQMVGYTCDCQGCRAEAAISAKEAALSEMRADLEQWQTVKHSSHWKERATAAETELSEAKNVLTLLLCVDFDRFTEHDELLLDTVLADAKAFLAARAASQDEGEERK